MKNCITGKRSFESREVAEDVLIELWGKNDYTPGQGPVSVYQCDDCGYFHLTSSGPMNERLSDSLKDGTITRLREANKWIEKWKRK